MKVLLTAAKDDFDFFYPCTAAGALVDEVGRISAMPDADVAYTYELEVPSLGIEAPLAIFSAKANRRYDRAITFDSASLTSLETFVSENVEAPEIEEAPASGEETDATEAMLADGECLPDRFSFYSSTSRISKARLCVSRMEKSRRR